MIQTSEKSVEHNLPWMHTWKSCMNNDLAAGVLTVYLAKGT